MFKKESVQIDYSSFGQVYTYEYFISDWKWT